MIRLLPILALPFIELWLLIELGVALGAAPVLLYVLATAAVGMWLLRRQALSLTALAERARDDLGAGRPTRPLILGPHALWAVVAILIAFPGVISDGAALGLAIVAWRHRAQDRERPRARTHRAAPPPLSSDVEIIPPGRIPSPFRRRPTIIDV